MKVQPAKSLKEQPWGKKVERLHLAVTVQLDESWGPWTQT